MQASSKVIKRNSDQFSAYKNLLVFGPPNNDDLSFLCASKMIAFDYRAYLSQIDLNSHQDNTAPSIEYTCKQLESSSYDAAIVFLPKSKGELELVLAFVAPMLKQGADLYLVGEKKAGIASAAKLLNKYGDNSCKIDSAKHCQLWQTTAEQTAKAFDLKEWFSTYTIEIDGIPLVLATLPGVFSFGRLDLGSELLLKNMFTWLRGRILDFGCGNGVIGVYAKLLNPQIELELVDINCLALECARYTCELNTIEADVYPSNAWSDVAGRVDGVLTNPPFHAGVSTEYQTTECFIQQAKDKMTKHAPMLLVANSFLKYAKQLEAAFGSFDLLAENGKFRIYKTFR